MAFGRKKKFTLKQKIVRRMRHLNDEEMLSGRFLVDTSAIINRKVTRLAKKGLKGEVMIPNAAIAELENLANRGQDIGFEGLEEVAKLHHFVNISIKFVGSRPTEHQIKYAKSGEIDALIRHLAFENKAILITSDVVQAKSAEAYGLKVLFAKTKIEEPKKRFFFFGK
jgi:ATPase